MKGRFAQSQAKPKKLVYPNDRVMNPLFSSCRTEKTEHKKYTINYSQEKYHYI